MDAPVFVADKLVAVTPERMKELCPHVVTTNVTHVMSPDGKESWVVNTEDLCDILRGHYGSRRDDMFGLISLPMRDLA